MYCPPLLKRGTRGAGRGGQWDSLRIAAALRRSISGGNPFVCRLLFGLAQLPARPLPPWGARGAVCGPCRGATRSGYASGSGHARGSGHSEPRLGAAGEGLAECEAGLTWLTCAGRTGDGCGVERGRAHCAARDLDLLELSDCDGLLGRLESGAGAGRSALAVRALPSAAANALQPARAPALVEDSAAVQAGAAGARLDACLRTAPARAAVSWRHQFWDGAACETMRVSMTIMINPTIARRMRDRPKAITADFEGRPDRMTVMGAAAGLVNASQTSQDRCRCARPDPSSFLLSHMSTSLCLVVQRNRMEYDWVRLPRALFDSTASKSTSLDSPIASRVCPAP